MGLGTTPRRGDVSEGRRADAGDPSSGVAPQPATKPRHAHFVRDSVRTAELCRLEQRRRAVRRDDELYERPEGPDPSRAPIWMRRLRPRFVAPFVRDGALEALNARRASWVEAARPRRAPRTVKLPGREPGCGVETARVPAREVDPIKDAIDIAWAAGLFAGEGYCGAIRRGKHKTVHLAVKMHSEETKAKMSAAHKARWARKRGDHG